MITKTLLLAFWTLISLPLARAQALEVCTAVEIASPKNVTVRGTGGVSPHGGGLMLIDYTCPVATSNDFDLPAVVLIDAPKFSTPALAERFRKVTEKSLFQAVVEGRLECQRTFRVRKNESGEIVAGNGFGDWGIYRCQMRDATFLTLHILETK